MIRQAAQRGVDRECTWHDGAGPKDSDLKYFALLKRNVRRSNLAIGQPCIDWEPDPRNDDIIADNSGLNLAATAKQLGVPGIKRSSDEINRATIRGGERAIAYGSACLRIDYLSQGTPDLMLAAKEIAR